MRDDRGLVTLEWLLIVGAVAVLAGVSALAVQRVVDDTTKAPDDPLVRVIDADIAAALIADEAQAAFEAALADPESPYTADADAGFQVRCEAVAEQFDDVLRRGGAAWVSPLGPDGMPATADDVPARCTVAVAASLGG